MKIIGDYHTHTVYSHGLGTIRENVEEAYRKGLKTVAITDHGPGHKFYGIKKSKLDQMKKEIEDLRIEYPDMEILLGMEANVMDFEGRVDVDQEILSKLDFLIVGYHYGTFPRGLKNKFWFYVINPLSKHLKFLEKRQIERNTRALIRAMDRYPIKFISHPGSKARLDIELLGREASLRDVCLEINSSHSELSEEAIRKAMKTHVKFIVNSDAHKPERVGDCDRGLLRASKAGLEVERIINAI